MGEHPVSEWGMHRASAGRVLTEPETTFPGWHERASERRNAPRLAWHSVRKEIQDPFCPEGPTPKKSSMRMRQPLPSVLREEETRGTDTTSILGGKA